MMEVRNAEDLVIFEGTDFHGMVVGTRGGNDPGRERVLRLIEALKVVTEATKGHPQLDRRLAFAAYGLAYHMGGHISAWKRCEWIDDFWVMIEVIENYFDGT